MTLVLTIQGREAIWILADRRLTYKGRQPRDNARKIMRLQTTDGVALIGYAGVGSTEGRTEPSDWMTAVLRGRNLPLEQSLDVLARATKEQLPRHLSQVVRDYGSAAHFALIAGFVGHEARCYSIGVGLGPGRKPFAHYNRYLGDGRIPRIAVSGSGLAFLHNDQKWKRPLLNLVRYYDQGKLQALTVADHLARLNYDVHHGTRDGSVGPRCIVAWQNRVSGRYQGGGAHQQYTFLQRDQHNPVIPTVMHGMDVAAITAAIMPYTEERLRTALANREEPKVDVETLKRELAKLPSEPDESLDRIDRRKGR